MPACSTFQLCSLISVSEITLSVSVIFSLLLQVKVFVYCLGMSVSFCTCNCYVMRLHICALKVCRGCASCAFKLKYRHCLSFSYICPSLSFFLSFFLLFLWTPLFTGEKLLSSIERLCGRSLQQQLRDKTDEEEVSF